MSAEKYGVEKWDEKEETLREYAKMIRKGRRWASLASKRVCMNPDMVISESMSVLSVVSCRERVEVAEIGSGGGIMGVVLAISCPGWNIDLIESSARKCAFLAEAASSLGLGNAKVLNHRAEEAFPGKYDVVLSRAAGRLSAVAPVALDLVRAGGMVVALKGSEPGAEIDEIAGVLDSAGATAETVRPELPPYWKTGGVSLVVMRKM
jgi:16S rRNA (guanine(527)-N(7))-methyltransferase RsmG